MGFFVDRLVEYPGRIKITDTTTGNEQVVDVERQEGNIIEPGTLLNAANMNYGTTLGMIQFDPSASSGTVDGNLHSILDLLGWESDVMDGDEINSKKLLTNILNNLSFDFRLLDNVPLDNSGNVAANASSALIVTNIASLIPDGYKPVMANFRGTGNHTFWCWFFSLNVSGLNIQYRVHNAGNSTSSVTPSAQLLCVKIRGV